MRLSEQLRAEREVLGPAVGPPDGGLGPGRKRGGEGAAGSRRRLMSDSRCSRGPHFCVAVN
eukprot:9466808-Pyramimonas_sp.AAC.1